MKLGTKHKPETIELQRRKARELKAAKRALRLVTLGEIREAERGDTMAPHVRPFARQATAEAAGWIDALGGPDRVSPQRRAIIDDAGGRLGLLVRLYMARIVQGDSDPDLASRVGTLIGLRRSALVALGLDRVESDALDLRGYLESKRTDTAPAGASQALDAAPDPMPTDAEIAQQSAAERAT